MELTGYVSIARRWWRLLLAATVAAALVGILAAGVLPPTYEARAAMLVGPVNTDLDTQRAAGGLARTYADLALTRTVLEPIASDFHIDVKDLEDATNTTASEATRFVTVVVRNEDPKVAANIANRISKTLVVLATNALSPAGTVTIVDVAEPPEDRAAPSIPLVVALTTAAGLVAALLLLVLMETFSRVFRDRAEIERVVHPLSVSLLSRVRNATARGTRSADLALVTGHLLASARSTRHVRVAIVGTSGGDSTAYAAARLATELAPFGGRVSVIDAGDGHAASLLVGWRPAGEPHSLPSPAADHAEVEKVRLRDGGTVELVHPAVRPVASGGSGTAFAAGHDSDRTVDLVRVELGAGITIIDIDVPGSSAERLAWLQAAGAAIVVVAMDKTRREDLERTLKLLGGFDIAVLGVVVVQRAGPMSRFRPMGLGRQRNQPAGPKLEPTSMHGPGTASSLPLGDRAETGPTG